jgi:pimeloyl-ACP methyl ester carboxylesterase
MTEPTLFVDGADGVRIAVHDLGGRGEPLLLLHATGFCAHAYGPLVAHLIGHHHLWGVDLRGHGHSTAPGNGNFDWFTSAADVLAAVDAIGARELVAFGHSLGGAMVLLAELARPGLVRAGYLFEPIVWPTGFAHPGGENPLATGARRRREVFASRAEALERYASRPPLGMLRADCLAAYVEHGFADLDDGTVRLRCRGESEAATFNAEIRVTVDRVTSVGSRLTLAVGGRRPPPSLPGPEVGPAALAPAIVATLPDARLIEYPTLGHFGPLQDPETIAADILAAVAP